MVDVESQADLPYNSTFSNLEILEAVNINTMGEKIPVTSNAIRTVELKRIRRKIKLLVVTLTVY